jgi:UDP-N-acetylmuramoylalanine--D-glutamate ligase
MPAAKSLKIQRPIAIVGMGVTGEATLRLLLTLGYARNEIVTFDRAAGADTQNPENLLQKNIQTMIVSPGVPLATDWIQKFRHDGGLLLSELSISFAHLQDEKVICVTGSLGKSTTTSMIGEGARVMDPDAFVGGNLGTPLAVYAADVFEGKRPRAKYVVLELSSYQLENFPNLRSDVSVFTFLSPNHLERYPNLQAYYLTKLRLIEFTTGALVVNKNGGELEKVFPKDLTLPVIWSDKNDALLKEDAFAVVNTVGSHNRDNLSLAAQVGKYFQWSAAAMRAMAEFHGLGHRLESCGRRRGVLFINDSKATTMDSVLQAVHSVLAEVQDGKKLHLLLGGKDKNLPWENLQILNNIEKISASFFGACGEMARTKSGLRGPYYSSMKTALQSLPGSLSTDDVVLLSPGGTSLDEFKNFEERGDYFKNFVLSLK